jgi:hypothetical protein
MQHVLYIVAREQPLLAGYLRARVTDRRRRESVEIKLDERSGEDRRVSSESREPDRRGGERRVRPSLADELQARGYAMVTSRGGVRTGEFEPAIGWRPRSTWGQRVARASRRRWVPWAALLVVLVTVGGSLVVAGQYLESRRDAPGAAAPPPTARLEPVVTPAPRPAPPAAPRVTPPTTPPAAPRAAAPVGAPSTPPATVAPPAAVVPRVEPPATRAAAKADPAPAPPPEAKAAPTRPEPARFVSRRTSGTVLSVDSRARLVVLEERGAGGAVSRLRVELAPDARVAVSERDPRAQDPTHPFRDTTIDLAEVRPGDYVVVQTQGPEGKELGRSVVVTLRGR